MLRLRDMNLLMVFCKNSHVLLPIIKRSEIIRGVLSNFLKKAKMSFLLSSKINQRWQKKA